VLVEQCHTIVITKNRVAMCKLMRVDAGGIWLETPYCIVVSMHAAFRLQGCVSGEAASARWSVLATVRLPVFLDIPLVPMCPRIQSAFSLVDGSIPHCPSPTRL
jgi:p-aminobenzoyl-glutamate transporter AbgT